MSNRKPRPFYSENNREHLTSRYRLRGFDYTTSGFYFLTIPVAKRAEVFGRIVDGEIDLSPVGRIVSQLVSSPPSKFSHFTIDAFVIMPNHVHLLTYISIENETTTPSDYVKWLKGSSTAAYRQAVRSGTCSDLGSKLWQVGFNDEIVRNDAHLDSVRKYIAENVARWEEDGLGREGEV